MLGSPGKQKARVVTLRLHLADAGEVAQQGLFLCWERGLQRCCPVFLSGKLRILLILEPRVGNVSEEIEGTHVLLESAIKGISILV